MSELDVLLPEDPTGPPSPAPGPVTRTRAWRNVALFVATFAAAVALLRATLPERGGLHTDAKLAAFEQRKQSIDVLFLGSSRTYRGFVPEVFERELAARGHSFTAFNFGVMGNRASESLEILKRVQRMQPGRLAWIFVDPEPLDMLIDEPQPRTRRVIDWHDAQACADVARLVRASGRPLRDQARLLWQQWIPFSYHQLNVGAAQPWLNALLGRGFDAEQQAEFLGPRGDGYRAMDEDILERAARGDAYGELLVERFPAQVARLSQQRSRLELPGPSLAAERAVFYQRLESLSAELGAGTVFVVQPTVTPREDLPRAASQGLVEHLLDYGDPRAHPELYTLESRYDVAHASPSGAEAFTRALARDFAALLEADLLEAELLEREGAGE